MKARAFVCVALASSLLALGGCKGILKKRTDVSGAASAATTAADTATVTPTASAPAAPTATDAAPPPVALDEASVPTPQDFEEEAAQKVTPANFKAELAKLQKEIGN